MPKRAALALAAFTGIVGVTVAWWTLALWPDAGMPAWVQRTRAVCFGVPPGGLPSAAGWLSLIGEPLGMFGFLLIVWGDSLREGMQAMRRSVAGRAAMAAAVTLCGAGLLLVAARVRSANAEFSPTGDADAVARVNEPAPPLVLVDQHGDTVSLTQFRGRPVVLTFAYAHCETVCPTIVRDVVRAASDGERDDAPVLLVVTLDPWRDTPARLPHLADAWHLPPAAHALSGDTTAVVKVLDAWHVVRGRDQATGEVAHQPLVILLDRAGRVAYRLAGSGADLRALVSQL